MPKVPIFQQQRQDWTGLTPTYPRPTGGELLGQGLMNLGGSLQRIQKERQDKMDRLFVSDRKNKLVNRRRQEHIHNLKIINPEDANGFTLKERMRIEGDESRESFFKDTPGRLQSALTTVFNNVNKGHLDKTATQVELSKTKEWEETIQNANVIQAQEEAIGLSIGKMPELFNILDGLKMDLIDNPLKAEVHGRDILANTFRSWARVSPEGAEQFLIAYNSQLQDRMGTDYNKLGVAIQEGRKLYEWEKETKYKWSQRALIENQETTTKEGVTNFLDPQKRLTIDWIVSKEKDITNTQMRILYNLLSLQDAKDTLTIGEVDWNEYGRLTSMVKDDDVRKLGEINMIDQIVLAIKNKKIMPIQGQDLLKLVTAAPKLDAETKRGLDIVDKLELDRNENKNIMMKEEAKTRFISWKIKNPNGDVNDYINNVVNPEVEEHAIEDLNNQLEDLSAGRRLLYEVEEPMAVLSDEDHRKISITREELERSKLPHNILAPMGIPDIRSIKDDPETNRILYEMIRKKEEREVRDIRRGIR
jgi:hypothetical protein